MAEEGLPPKEATRKSMGQIGAHWWVSRWCCQRYLSQWRSSEVYGAIYRQFSITIVSAMALSVLVALILTLRCVPPCSNRLLKAITEKAKGFFGWFNRMFDKSTHHYTDSVGRYSAQHRSLSGSVSDHRCGHGLSVRSSAKVRSCQMKTGVFLSMAQLPAGASQERTQKVLDEMTDYYRPKEKANVESGVCR